MEPIENLSSESAARITHLLTDIDDTLTHDGFLVPEAYASLWRLRYAGISVIPVTGRPAGWCDCIARQWPVDAVVGENGAFVLYRDGETIAELIHPDVADPEHHRRLEEVRRKVLELVPDARVARDQPYRRFDLAIDFREDPPRLGYDVAADIAAICRGMGAEAKISSIHVNTWFGAYDKVKMAQYFFEHVYGIPAHEMKLRVAFSGDSPNDEPMFSFFPVSCAVRNIEETLDHLSRLPAYITIQSYGAGFAEFVETILRKRSVSS